MSNGSQALESGRVFIIEGVLGNLGPLYSLREVPDFISKDYHDHWNRGRELISRIIGVVDSDLLLYLETMDQIIAKSRTIEGQVELQNNWNEYMAIVQNTRTRYVTELELESVPRLLKKYVQNHSRLTCANLALAVEQYRRANGFELPMSLGDLVPDFIESVPDEPYSGKPYELILGTNGYGIGRGSPEFSVTFPTNEPAGEDQ
jgi:hypothetical protein